jgi:hypothetical protein
MLICFIVLVGLLPLFIDVIYSDDIKTYMF